MRLIEKVWFHGHNAKWWLVPLLLPLTALFYLLTALRRLLYRLGLKQSAATALPVIVIGNIGIGGNGKTPLTIYLIELCNQLNINVGVVSRGYGGDAPHYPYLLDHNSTAKEAGDEPYMIYTRCDIPVAVGSDRIAAIKLLEQQGCDLVLADDGLQHYKMARAKEIIVVDGNRKFGNGLLLPAGPLREGKWRLNTVDAVVVNGAAQVISEQLNMALAPVELVNIATGEQLGLEEFNQRFSSVNAIAAIGDPSRFFNTLNQCSISCNQAVGYVDHHAFTEDELATYDALIPLVMTEKDAVKCRTFAQSHWWYLAVSAQFNAADIKELNRLIKSAVRK